MINSLPLINELLLAGGYPRVDGSVIDPAGVKQFLRGWRSRPAGSHEDLRAVLRLLDAQAQIEIQLEQGETVRPQERPPGALLASWPRQQIASVRVIWQRAALRQSAGWRAWCHAVLKAWLPLCYDVSKIVLNWSSMAIASVPQAPPHVNEDPQIAPPRRLRYSSASARTLLSVQGDCQVRSAGSLIVASENMRQYLANAEPFCPVWQVLETKGSTARWRALRDTSTIDVLVAGAARARAWKIQGFLLQSTPVLEQVERIQLEQQVSAGTVLEIVETAKFSHARGFYPNPVVFESVNKQGVEYLPAALNKSDICQMLISGYRGINSIYQPGPITATTETPFSLLLRLADVVTVLRQSFAGLSAIHAAVETRWNTQRRTWERVLMVTGYTPHGCLGSNVWKHAVRRLLQRRLQPKLPLNISIYSQDDPHANTNDETQSLASRAEV